MAQATFTPIQLYRSTNATATPSTSNLAEGELAINITDGKLFYKDNLGALQVIARKSSAVEVLAVANGGTGIITVTQGGIAYGGATTYLFTAAGTSGDLLRSNGTSAPTWTTPTSANTASTIVSRDASGNFSAGTITATLTGSASSASTVLGGVAGSVLYQSGVGSTSFLAPGASGTVLTMSSGGLPVWSSAGSATLASNLAGGAAGSVPYQSAPNATAFLAAGTSGQVLTLTSAQIPAWQTPTAATSIANISGGTAGALPYQSAPSTTAFLSAGTSGQILTLTSSNIPAWTTPQTITSIANLSGGALNKVPVQSGVGSTTFIDAPTSSSYLKYSGTGFEWANPVTSVSAGTGMSFSAITASGAVAIDTAVVPRFGSAGTFTATQTFQGSSSTAAVAFNNALESCTVNASAPSGAINIDLSTQSIIYYTANASTTWTVNFRGSSTTPLSSFMASGQSITSVMLAQTGATTLAYLSAITIDGVAPTLVKWLGGAPPTAGNASSIDVYSFTIIRTGVSTYTVLASQAKFA